MRDDLIPFSFGGNKVRIALKYFEDMERKHCDCIIAYGNRQSNLCRAVSNLSASRGIPCYIVSSIEHIDKENETNNEAMVRMTGAKIIFCSKDNVALTIAQVLYDSRKLGMEPYYVYGDIYGNGNENIAIQAYVEAYADIVRYESENHVFFDYIFLASGTGLTQSAIICGDLANGCNKNIVGISIAHSKEQGREKIFKYISGYTGKIINKIYFEDKYLYGGYGKYSIKIIQTVKDVFRLDGIALDPIYTGKAFNGMINYLKENNVQNKNILFLHSGGLPIFFDTMQKILFDYSDSE
ncbi:MAG: pyridoxal-phosphate dependent enzyme [Synergistaceae bacterium]|nr:pyridoxal-phosphate dependent enzyme [Synergistaceae bacterium]